jgi:filamentous hemagglutinin family protein
MAEGKSNQKIADQLVISERTVKFHVSSILGKLEVENRTAAVLKATRNGILAQSNG